MLICSGPDKMTEYKERYRGLKASMLDKDKQLDLAKRTIERLSGQCNAMEVCLAAHPLYSMVGCLHEARSAVAYPTSCKPATLSIAN